VVNGGAVCPHKLEPVLRRCRLAQARTKVRSSVCFHHKLRREKVVLSGVELHRTLELEEERSIGRVVSPCQIINRITTYRRSKQAVLYWWIIWSVVMNNNFSYQNNQAYIR
jgi:hypothetical protein